MWKVPRVVLFITFLNVSKTQTKLKHHMRNDICMDSELMEYKKAIEMLEAMEDIIGNEKDENLYERYKVAFKQNKIAECIMLLLRTGKKDAYNFKKAMLLSNALLNPLSMKFNEEDFKKTMYILKCAYEIADEVPDEPRKTLREFIIYTKILYENNKVNSAKLEKSDFFKYSLSKQLRMLFIYVQDQSRLMYKKLHENNNGYITGMESELATYNVDYYPWEKTSLSNNYEAILEFVDKLISYLYYVKKEDFKLDDINTHGDINHFKLPELSGIFVLAQQRKLYEMFEEKFRYSLWNIGLTKREDQTIYFLKSSNELKTIAHHIAITRRSYKVYSNSIIHHFDLNESAKSVLKEISNKFDLKNIQNFHFSKEEYEATFEIREARYGIAKSMLKDFYFEIDFKGITLDDILNTYTFLCVYSTIYMLAVDNVFEESDYTTYKYLVPVINIEYFVKEISFLFDVSEEKASKLLECFIYNPKQRNCEAFTNPLLMVNDSQILLCETLISTFNMERLVSKLLHKHDISYAAIGPKYEEQIRNELEEYDVINVNTNKIQFKAFDGKDVEFDLLATFEDHLLIIELKSLTTPYGDEELKSKEKVILEGADQVNRRAEIVQHDWEMIRSQANIDLPEKPYIDTKIIKLVCTDIYDFTTLKYKGVTVIDDISLLKYFSPFGIMKTQFTGKIPKEIEIKSLHKSGKPTIKEFKEYIEHPATIEYIPSCLKEHFKPIPFFEGEDENPIGIFEYSLMENPYTKQIENKTVPRVNKKPGRNEKCSCGSGEKYKNCCGK